MIIVSSWAIKAKTLHVKLCDNIPPELLLLLTLCSSFCVAPTDLSQWFWLDHLQVTHSNHPHTGTPPLLIVPNITCSCCSWEPWREQQLEPKVYEQEQMSVSQGPLFLSFPSLTLVLLPTHAEPRGPYPTSLSSNVKTSITIVRTPVEMPLFFWDNWEDGGERLCHTPETRRAVNL